MGTMNDVTGDALISRPSVKSYLDRFDMAFNTEKFRKKAIEQIVAVTATEHSTLAVHECELANMSTEGLWAVYEARVINKQED